MSQRSYNHEGLKLPVSPNWICREKTFSVKNEETTRSVVVRALKDGIPDELRSIAEYIHKRRVRVFKSLGIRRTYENALDIVLLSTFFSGFSYSIDDKKTFVVDIDELAKDSFGIENYQLTMDRMKFLSKLETRTDKDVCFYPRPVPFVPCKLE